MVTVGMAEADTKQTSEEVSWADSKSGLGIRHGDGGGWRKVDSGREDRVEELGGHEVERLEFRGDSGLQGQRRQAWRERS